ncbi:MAG TPA: alpha/beta hydrolase family protein [Candidatus Limnocylindria bacterium]|nr:alpha/beta hydrolase family protein [Candidatus Limnocylindria bacterium]
MKLAAFPIAHRPTLASVFVVRATRWLVIVYCVMTSSLWAAEDPTSRDNSVWLTTLPRVPELQIPEKKADWAARKEGIRSNLWHLLGKLPPRPGKPTVEVLSRNERDGFIEERFRFDNGAGEKVPGVLLLPKEATEPVPAILYCHWHGGEYDGGKIELFQTNHTPYPPGPTYARRGFAVLAIDAAGFGERNGTGPDGEKGSQGEASASKFNLWAGRTLWGMMLRDDLMALDYLCSRPEIDTNKVGVTGMSMGATRTWWLMALDDRLKSGAAIACLTRYQDLIAAGQIKQHGIYYFVPGMLEHFDTEAVLACIAPRAIMCLNGTKDSGSPVAGIRKIDSILRPLWRLHEADWAFRCDLYPGVGHEYTRDMWAKTLSWFDETLAQ